MTFLSRTVRSTSLAVVLPIVLMYSALGEVPDSLEKLRKSRVDAMSSVYTGTRQDLQRIADATILSEQAVRQAARERNITVTEEEVQTFLIPLLTKQGLIDPSVHTDISMDQNMNRWLSAQHWSTADLLNTGEVLLLWVKIAVQGVSISEADLNDFVSHHPEIYSVPVRVQLSLSLFTRPQGAAIIPDGIAKLEALSPTMPKQSRAVVTQNLKSESVPDLQLYLDLNHIDPVLRKQLEGKKIGDRFGPLTLQDGTIVAGSVVSMKPSIDLSKSKDFWQYAAVLCRLDKVDQRQKFIELTTKYIDGINNPAVKGLFGDLLGVVGTGIGSLFGGVGAPVGGALGSMVGGWVDGQVNSPPPAQAPPFPPSPMPGGIQPFMQSGFPPPLPPIFQSFAPPPPLQFIPPMPQAYPSVYPTWPGMFPPIPWAPPIYAPFPMRMF